MSDVQAYLQRSGVACKRSGTTQLVMDCPACGKERKAYIHRDTWLWDCKVCGEGGNELTLKRSLGHLPTLPQKTNGQSRPGIGLICPQIAPRWQTAGRSIWVDPRAQEAVLWLRGRGLTDEVLKDAGIGWVPAVGRQVGRATGPGWVTLPAGDGAKCRALDPNASTRYLMQGKPGLFQPFGVDPHLPLVITAGEIDCLSWAVAGHRNVVAGTTGEAAWSDEWTALLAECDDLVVVYDNDDPGRAGARAMADRLGHHRVRLGQIPDPHKDSNDALQAGDLDPSAILAAAKHIPHEGVTTVEEAGQIYLRQLDDPGSMVGTPTGWTDLDHLLGGWRDGEVTLVTGDTGTGKTTLASQAALIQAQAGRGVLMCPFELGPVRQVGKWVRQHLGQPPVGVERKQVTDCLEKLVDLPLWMYSARGELDIETVRQTLLYSIHRLGTRFVVLDHLHFICGEGQGERSRLDGLMRVCAEVAVDTGAHILALAHPSKMSREQGDNAIVQANDLKGSSGLKQLADNVLSVWRPRNDDRSDVVDTDGLGNAVVYVMKCRSEYGREGAVALRYDPGAAQLLDDRAAVHDSDGGMTIDVRGGRP